MLALDYFLYDNRTWAAGIGRDWGIKCATGVLASREDLRCIFARYCAQLAGERGYLRAFGQALGGLRARDGKGYLLCVTAETSDPFGRPSWSTYGLWCPDDATLERALLTDVTQPVKLALRANEPPPAMVLPPPTPAPAPQRTTVKSTVFRPFDPQSTLAEVRTLLRGTTTRKGGAPNVLGITANARSATLGRDFDVIYYHPFDDESRRAFEKRAGATAGRFELVPETAKQPLAAQRNLRRRFWISASVVTIACLCAPRVVEHLLTREPIRVPASLTRQQILHRDLARRIAAIRTLKPLDLDDLAGRSASPDLRAACDALKRQRQQVIGQIAVLSSQTPNEPCRVLRDLYPEDFKNPQSTARRWCDSFAQLERTTAALRGAPSTTPPLTAQSVKPNQS